LASSDGSKINWPKSTLLGVVLFPGFLIAIFFVSGALWKALGTGTISWSLYLDVVLAAVALYPVLRSRRPLWGLSVYPFILVFLWIYMTLHPGEYP
jgi:hypothetical protein